MAQKVAGELYESIIRELFEIGRQVHQPGGYPFDLEKLQRFLQRAVEGRFHDDRRWYEENGVIYFSVTSDGTTGEDWIQRFKKKGFHVGDCAKSVLRSPDFKPTHGVTYRIAVLKGILFTDGYCTTSDIREYADKRKLTKPNAEVACLIREMFSDEELEAMGLRWIVVFHEPIKDSNGYPDLLGTWRGGGGRWLSVFYGGPVEGWNSDDGFAFALSRVSS